MIMKKILTVTLSINLTKKIVTGRWQNKLPCFVSGKYFHFQPSILFEGNAGIYSGGALYRAKKIIASKIKLGRKNLPVTNTLAYFVVASIRKKKCL
jgi:hypothetical protein